MPWWSIALRGHEATGPALINAIARSDPIDVCFGPLCGLRSDILRGPRTANRVLTPCRKFAQLLDQVVCLAAQLREGKARRRVGEDARGNRIHAGIARIIGNLRGPNRHGAVDLLGVTRAEQLSPATRTT